jgi:hypothetical protein
VGWPWSSWRTKRMWRQAEETFTITPTAMSAVPNHSEGPGDEAGANWRTG